MVLSYLAEFLGGFPSPFPACPLLIPIANIFNDLPWCQQGMTIFQNQNLCCNFTFYNNCRKFHLLIGYLSLTISREKWIHEYDLCHVDAMSWQVVTLKIKLMLVFCVCTVIANEFWQSICGFDNFITKFMINNRIDPWKTKVSLLMHPFLGILVSTPQTCKNNDLYINTPLILFLLLKRVSSPFETKWGKRLGTLFGEKSWLEGMSQTIVLTCVSSNNQVITSGKIFLKRWWHNVKECGSGVSIQACQCIS